MFSRPACGTVNVGEGARRIEGGSFIPREIVHGSREFHDFDKGRRSAHAGPADTIGRLPSRAFTLS